VETEDQLSDTQLRDALHRSMRGVDPPVHDLVSAAVRDGRSTRRSSAAAWAAGGLAAAVVVAVVAATRPWADPEPEAATGARTAPAAASCGPAPETVLPRWATAGFSDPRPVITHVTGEQGHIVAILFGRVLHAPPADDVNNKILWVARTSSMEPLQIDAVRDGEVEPVHREVAGGPSPSTIDLPRAGCWHLTLRWGAAPDQRDTMDLQYVDPR
jgi:hypothetical protein